jgi:DNA-binding transcriptional MerR regulator
MRGTLTISALAKLSGVSSKTLRYWESLGLLPRAARSHTGYRLFQPGSVPHIEFIQKAKSIGLSLADIAKVLQLARDGHNPCPDVVQWAEQKAALLQQQIALLSALRQRLERFRRDWSKRLPCPRLSEPEICCLIEDLPSPKSAKGGAQNAKALVATTRRTVGAGR